MDSTYTPSLLRACFISAMMFCLPAMAGERNEQQILEAAAHVLGSQSSARSQSGDVSRPSLHILQRRAAVTIVGAEGGGFALVSNDEGLRPVLGYSREGIFNPEDNLPCGFEWYLDALDERLRHIGTDGYEWTPIDVRPADGVKSFVEPLIETDWYQGAPFNDWCPTYVNDKGMVRHHAVGCVGTAVAQVMYYHRHPVVGRGETTYSYNSKQVFNDHDSQEENIVTLSCRFDTVFFNWDSMLAHYDRKRSTDERVNEAVARLCKAVGIALHMTYTETTGSGSSINRAARALPDHFGYAPDTRILSRSRYADATWMQTVFEELSNGRPILYRGQPEPDHSGHAFVFDGYDADGLVHINWGWGNNAYYDGYFDINYLSANHSDSHYSVLQSMVVGLRPEEAPIEMTALRVATPGTLSSLIPANSILRLKVTGSLDANDLTALRQLGQGIIDTDSLVTAELTHLDLSEATMPGDALPENAFDGCKALLDVVLPSSLKSIGDRAFHNCSQLQHIDMPSGLRTIGQLAFQNCNALTDITIPRDVETIGDAAFAACLANERFTVEQGNTHFATIDGLLTNAAKNRLVCFPAKRTEATIPASIDSIGRYAFRYCTNLKALHIPGTVRVIDVNAFMNCANVSNITIDEGVRRILSYAFNNCDALTTLRLPATIDSIGRRPFIYCDNIQQVTMNDANPNFRVVNNCLLSRDGKQLVQALLSETETVDIPASVESIGLYAFYYTNITHLTIPKTVRKVGNQSIFFCQKLAQLDIAEGVEQIDHYAFNGCSALTEVHLPASLVSVGYGIFCNCTALSKVDISEASPLFRTDDNMLFSKDGKRLLRQLADDREEYAVPPTVTAIDQGCFRYLNRLQRLTIPESVASISHYVLYGCKNLTDVYCQASAPIRLGNYVFAQTDLSAVTLHVPAGCRNAYSVANGWSLFGNIVDDLPFTPIRDVTHPATEGRARKVLKNHRIVIERNGHEYNVSGIRYEAM